MSTQTVRQAFYEGWAVPGLPLIKTINQSADFTTPDPPVWATFGFDAMETSAQTMGSNPWFEEVGVVGAFISADSGITDETVAVAAQAVRDFWLMWISPDKNIWVTMVVGPRPPDPDAQGVSYSLIVELHYRHQFRGA